ncbi:MAG TPA: hypothetical protein VFP56_03745, partial [Candidatus Limnocylindrales bacterium]|nr:hypothetical protein [Candidatus Limnocylindrales bacterium]
NVTATDTESAIETVEISTDGLTWGSSPYAPTVVWEAFDPASGGSAGPGMRTVRVRWTDTAGNTSAEKTTRLFLGNGGALELLNAPVTGQSLTIKPIFGPGRTQPLDETCSWELVWGNAAALKAYAPNETYGSLFMAGVPSRGYCGPWTFKVPYVQGVPFEVHFNASFMSAGDEDYGHRATFLPAAGSTERRILSSNLALVQILPNRYSLLLGQSLTYTAYPIGTTLRSDDLWSAYYPGSGDDSVGPRYKLQHGGSTFSFTPPTSGTWFVTWNGFPGRPIVLNATYDPKVRKRDLYPPNTTKPVERLTPGATGPLLPVSITWVGTDTGWGIASYQLQRSLDGAAWTGVSLPSAKATTIIQQLAQGHSVRYRVRAKDAYGNVGSWDYGPTFTPRMRDESRTGITFAGSWPSVPDATALNGALRASSTAGASVTYAFTGRDVAWVAAKGPGLGRARVYIDGSFSGTVDLQASSDRARQGVYRVHWSESGRHVIKIVVEGTAERPEVNVDAFAVLQ